jgi:diaminohydroxyphosphoribosylaminopyrimidine deaminase / 5-amino-6-(5-phosphoribosylamino)uracil reductase
LPSSADSAHLRRALRLAERGRYHVSPNPRVGAVVVDTAGAVVGEGWHARVGGPHAEPVALDAAGARARGGTLFVTLEPCAHHGRTPPCVDAVLAAGIRRVVACHRDPDPRTGGAGFARLRAAGIAVEVGLLAAEAVEANAAFLISQTLGRPLVTLKWAMSLDGKIATAAGESQWISHPAGRRWALELRETHDAILVGSGAALSDDPRLDRRLGRAGTPLLRAVADRRLRLPATARMLGLPGETVVYTRAGSGSPAGRRALAAAGAQLVDLPTGAPAEILADLHARGLRSVLVEGGGEIHGAFVTAGLFDRVMVDAAPVLLGGAGAPAPVGGLGTGPLATAPRLDRLRFGRRGDDAILWGWRRDCLPDLLRSVGAS